MAERRSAAPRCVALVGPYLSGKTTLMESLLFASGATNRKGSVRDGNTVGDAAPEARARRMSVEVTAACANYLGDQWIFLDCPGSVELLQETQNALMVVDAAVVVCDPEPTKTLTLAPLLKFLDDHKIPHMMFINKMDTAMYRVREVLTALQAVSTRPLVLRQIPIRSTNAKGEEEITGYVDLVSERGYRYKPGEASDLITMPETIAEQEKAERQQLLESLADFDDQLLEQLLEDAVPSKEEIYSQIRKDLAGDLIVPVLLGAGERDHGVRRLLKALRHDVPEHTAAVARFGLEGVTDTVAAVCKTYHQPHTGKLSLARVLTGKVSEGMTLNGMRVGGVFRMMGQQTSKLPAGEAGDVVALGRMDEVPTGTLLSSTGKVDTAFEWPAKLTPVYSLAIDAENRADEVKLSAALAKLVDEDPSLQIEHNPASHELVVWGQGEIHLQIAFDRLRTKYNLPVKWHRPQVGYRETIRRGVTQHARHKRQSGGHGQFGDVHVRIRPLSRGDGFVFLDEVVGGVIPRQYIPSVEEGVRDYLHRGPLGFEVVDVEVALFDGQYHTVDSSDMAFKTAGRMAMSEGMPKCDPVLLEPICEVRIAVPNEFTNRVHTMISGRRGQILGFDTKEGWPGWDEVSAYLPQPELHDLIVELRSATMGVGTFAWKFHHLQELTGRLAEKVAEQRAGAAAG